MHGPIWRGRLNRIHTVRRIWFCLMYFQMLFHAVQFFTMNREVKGVCVGNGPQGWKLSQSFFMGVWPDSLWWTENEGWVARLGERWVSQSSFRNEMWTWPKIAVMLSLRVWINPPLSLLTSVKLILATESQPTALALQSIKKRDWEAVESICSKYSQRAPVCRLCQGSHVTSGGK